MSALLGNGDHYGSFQVLGNLTVDLAYVTDVTDYKRSLDLDTGIHTNTFFYGPRSYERYRPSSWIPEH
jgi:alpha-L-fucosidase 2